MGLSHIYRAIKNAHPELNFAEAHTMAQKVAGSWWMQEPAEPNRQLAIYAEGFRNINRTFGKMGSKRNAFFDIEAYPHSVVLTLGELSHMEAKSRCDLNVLTQLVPTTVRLDNVRLSSPDLIRKLRLNSEFPRMYRWPCSGDSLRSTPIKLDSGFLSSDDLEDLIKVDPRQQYIDRLMDRRHRQWQEVNGLAPSPRERFDKLITSMTTAEALDTLGAQQRSEILGKPYGAHTLETHINCKVQHCNICDGGLAYCKVCHGAEASLPTECPGVAMTPLQQDEVTACRVDFKGGRWIVTQDKPQ